MRFKRRFALLEREGAQLVIEQPADPAAGGLTHPCGRGADLQIEVADVLALHVRLTAAAVHQAGVSAVDIRVLRGCFRNIASGSAPKI